MVLALGCQAAPDSFLASTGQSVDDWTDLFLNAAQFFLGQSPYLISTALTTFRTLCLSIMALMMEIVKGSELTHVVRLIGLLTHSARTLQLHRKTALLPNLSTSEAEIRRRIWVTVQLLDVDLALRSGTSFLHQDHDAEMPLAVDDPDFSLPDSTYQIKLAELLPTLAEIIKTVNSPTNSAVPYDMVCAWDKQLRQQLQDAEVALSMPPDGKNENSDKVRLQVNFLAMLVHRTLIALHQNYISEIGLSIAILHSSLKVLQVHQAWHTLAADGAGDQTRTVSSQTLFNALEPVGPAGVSSFSSSLPTWLVDLCHDHFTAAMFNVILALRRVDFEAVGKYQASSMDDSGSSDVASRPATWTVLRQNLELKHVRACRSAAHFREFFALAVAVGCLESIDAGEPMLPTTASPA
ncbi:hypothetical protein QBC47DRAFT_35165 [Echria macrotheca]|uniref:Xylanolytic transcriptional activator regulatory domain-containing protein n=1 Tax=Echria macrotheca TaxID=438768 RepID=A0AAJ0B9D1_9PEZI|nr:hypothetical protein QBC47DRAFT_35165 [Echria macrotheca]